MKINSIQYLRAVASILVVYYHSKDLFMQLGVPMEQDLRYLQNFGAIGVDIFFVISGFIITYVSYDLNGVASAITYLKKRFVRINPPYYAATAILLLLNFLIDPMYRPGLANIAKSISILPVFERGAHFVYPVIFVGWTLAFEWYFYLLFALLIFLTVKRKGHVIVFLLVILTLFNFIPYKGAQFTFLTNPILWEFCFGVLICLLYKRVSMTKGMAIAILSGCVVFLFFVAYSGHSDISEARFINSGKLSWSRTMLWGIPSAMLVTGLLYLERSGGPGFKNRTMLLLGEASYAIYLTHVTSLTLFSYCLNRCVPIKQHLPMGILIVVFIMVAIIGGLLFHFFVEKKLIRLLKKH